MATVPRRSEEDEIIRATIESHRARSRQEFRAGLMVAVAFVVGLALIVSVGTPY